MIEEYDDWRVAELEEAWEIFWNGLTPEQQEEWQAKQRQKREEAERKARESREAFANMTPQQRDELNQSLNKAFDEHNKRMEAKMREWIDKPLFDEIVRA